MVVHGILRVRQAAGEFILIVTAVHVGDLQELADVVFVVLCLANQTGIDLQAAFDKKMDVKTKRDHDRHHNNEKLK